MLLHLILGSAALMAGAFTAGLILAVIGIQRGDHGQRLTGKPASLYRGLRPPHSDRITRLRSARRRGGR